jgi:hypothetical protein
MTVVCHTPREAQRYAATGQPRQCVSHVVVVGPGMVYECLLDLGAALPLGAHVVTSRVGYTHHGIHVGAGRIVHYSGLSRSWRRGPVEVVSLGEFSRGRPVRVRHHPGARFERDAVVARALSRLGENHYRALSNNCEHLCTWCIYGENRSLQVDALRIRWRQLLRGLGVLETPARLRSLWAMRGEARP